MGVVECCFRQYNAASGSGSKMQPLAALLCSAFHQMLELYVASRLIQVAAKAALAAGGCYVCRGRRPHCTTSTYTTKLSPRHPTSPITLTTVSITVQLRSVCVTVRPKYSLKSQKPVSFT